MKDEVKNFELPETQILETEEILTPLVTQIERTKSKKSYVMDLRIQSPVSMGYMAIEGIDAAPALVRLAKVKGLDVIAVTDFYSGAFVDRAISAAQGSAVTVVAGVTLRCALPACNDVTLTCLFNHEFSSAKVAQFLATLGVPLNVAGDRRYIVQKPMAEVLQAIDDVDGIAFPSRMDKTPYRKAVIGQLIEEFGFRTFDLAYGDSALFFKKNWPKYKFNLFSFSNANALAQVGSRSARVKLESPGFIGIKSIASRVAAV